MIKHNLLIKLLEQRLLKQMSYLGPIPPEATSDKSQSALDGYKMAVEEEVKFLRTVLEKPL